MRAAPVTRPVLFLRWLYFCDIPRRSCQRAKLFKKTNDYNARVSLIINLSVYKIASLTPKRIARSILGFADCVFFDSEELTCQLVNIAQGVHASIRGVHASADRKTA